MRRLRGNFFVQQLGVKAKFLTRDPARMASYDGDPLIARSISVRVLLGLYDASGARRRRCGRHHGAHAAPDLRRGLGREARPAARFLRPSRRDREGAPRPARASITTRSASATAHAPSPRRGASCCAGSPRRCVPRSTCATRTATRATRPTRWPRPCRRLAARPLLVGDACRPAARRRISPKASRLGHETGFDSGSTLDYVYRNTPPAGSTALGRAIDRNYLQSIGWRGIRQRKRHIEALLRRAIARSPRRGRSRCASSTSPPAMAGTCWRRSTGSAVSRPDSILLRDYSDINVEAGGKLIAEKDFADIARFVKGDAFDRASLATLAPRPTIAIVSGLYELFSDNAQVRASLAGLASALPESGILIYTGQPWHPQLELIARALTSHRGGQAWVMRRRTQAELDELVARRRLSQDRAAHRRVGHLHGVRRAPPRRDPAGAAAVVGARSPGSASSARFLLRHFAFANWLAVAAHATCRRSCSTGSAPSRSRPGRSFPTGSSTPSTRSRFSCMQIAARARHACAAPPHRAGDCDRLFHCTAEPLFVRAPSRGRDFRDALRGAARLRQAVQPDSVAAHRAGRHPLVALRAQCAALARCGSSSMWCSR